MRSAHHDEKGTLLDRYRCDLLAEKYGGGGHVGASSFFMKKKDWKKLMFEWTNLNNLYYLCWFFIELFNSTRSTNKTCKFFGCFI